MLATVFDGTITITGNGRNIVKELCPAVVNNQAIPPSAYNISVAPNGNQALISAGGPPSNYTWAIIRPSSSNTQAWYLAGSASDTSFLRMHPTAPCILPIIPALTNLVVICPNTNVSNFFATFELR